MAAPIDCICRIFLRKCFCFYLSLLVLFTLTIIFVGVCGDSSLSEDFEVKPGGQVWTTVKKLGPCKCTFEYAAQGGTNEKWLFEVTGSDDGTTYSCDIQRPSGVSYLFFQSFKASIELKGAQLKQVELFMDTDNSLKPEEYVTTKGKNEVTHNEGKFNSKLSRLLLIAERPRTEL
ncbi:myeloid-derived growth factor-like [Acanthaster planci]|uniref:Myeloid-derived growth factor-like n=1 Tax=Acanthaster planci TaxID=133434 RepID=A0A8B7ZNZ0_ACAPL|nr:myeloid-derived growth factor-like [Acanthaster planci]